MIRVEIQCDKLDDLGHDTLIGNRIIKSLKQAGVPVLGVFALRGITHGHLGYTMGSAGFDGQVHVFLWQEDHEDVTTKFQRTQLPNGVLIYKSGRHDDSDEL